MQQESSHGFLPEIPHILISTQHTACQEKLGWSILFNWWYAFHKLKILWDTFIFKCINKIISCKGPFLIKKERKPKHFPPIKYCKWRCQM